MFRRLVAFFDRFEDSIRFRLSRHPLVYSCIGAVGVILIWKGIWETAEHFAVLDGPGSILLGVLILLPTGLLVSFFIGDSIVMSGLRREKKLVEMTETEVRAEDAVLERIEEELSEMHQELAALKEER